jgi:type III secretion system chaperone SycN
MSQADAAIVELSAVLGLDLTDLADRPHIAVSISGLGELHVERPGEEVLLYLSRPIDVGADRLGVYKQALRAVHFENRLPVPVQCGLHDGALVLVARHAAGEVDRPALEASLELLATLHEKAAA